MEEIRRPKPSLSDVLPRVSQTRVKVNTIENPELERPVIKTKRAGSSFGKRLVFWLVLIIIIGGPAVFYISRTLTRVKVVVEPRRQVITLDEMITAARLPLEGGAESPVTFQIMNLETAETGTMPASGSEKVEEKARGEITIYNDFNAESQQLVATTRFETPSGKIYRLTEAVVVPGQKTVDGKLTPGSARATIVADAAGEAYNSAPTDFTIPGFRGGPRYDKFYARSKTPLTGGFIGERPKVAATDRTRTANELEAVIKDRLFKEAAISVPPGFIVFSEGVFFDFETVMGVASAAGNSNLTVKGVLSGIMFNRQELSRYLAADKIQDLGSDPITILEPEKLSFDLLSAETFDPQATQTIRFKLTGPATVIWLFDQNKLLTDLASQKRNDYQIIFSRYPSIVRATAKFSPPWADRFPVSTDRITLELTP